MIIKIHFFIASIGEPLASPITFPMAGFVFSSPWGMWRNSPPIHRGEDAYSRNDPQNYTFMIIETFLFSFFYRPITPRNQAIGIFIQCSTRYNTTGLGPGVIIILQIKE